MGHYEKGAGFDEGESIVKDLSEALVRERERVTDGDCRLCETEVRTTYRERRTTGVRELSVVWCAVEESARLEFRS